MYQGTRASNMDGFLKETEKKRKKKRLYFKNNIKAISCDNLLPLTKFIQEKDWSVIGFLESEF